MARFRRRKRRESEDNVTVRSGKTSSGTARVSAVSQLQGQVGNRAIERMNRSGVLQAKLEMGVAQRQAEEEEPVQKKAEEEEPLQGKSIQRQAEEEEPVQGKLIQRQELEEEVQKKEEEEEPVQKKEGVSPSLAASQNKTGLPGNLRAGLENLSGMTMDHVKVHYNSPKPSQLNALAYTQGKDIHVAPGQERHLPHEGWHVVQQAQGRVKPTMQMAGTKINAEAGLEKEADVMGGKALSVGRRVAQRTGRDVGGIMVPRPVYSCGSLNQYSRLQSIQMMRRRGVPLSAVLRAQTLNDHVAGNEREERAICTRRGVGQWSMVSGLKKLRGPVNAHSHNFLQAPTVRSPVKIIDANIKNNVWTVRAHRGTGALILNRRHQNALCRCQIGVRKTVADQIQIMHFRNMKYS